MTAAMFRYCLSTCLSCLHDSERHKSQVTHPGASNPDQMASRNTAKCGYEGVEWGTSPANKLVTCTLIPASCHFPPLVGGFEADDSLDNWPLVLVIGLATPKAYDRAGLVTASCTFILMLSVMGSQQRERNRFSSGITRRCMWMTHEVIHSISPWGGGKWQDREKELM